MSSTLLNARTADHNDFAATDRPRADAGSPPVAMLLKSEALLAVALALAVFQSTGASWWLFAALILAPDLSGIGYFWGTQAGAWAYDLVHTYVGPAILGAIGFVTHEPLVVAIAATWVTHIGFDRMIGYGLKFAGSAKDTHMSRASARR